MRSLADEKIWSFVDDRPIREVPHEEVSCGDASEVKSYRELVTKIAELHFKNPNHLLFFRGQDKDYRLKPQEVFARQRERPPSTIRPPILRRSEDLQVGAWHEELKKRYAKLEELEAKLPQTGELIDLFDQDASTILKVSGQQTPTMQIWHCGHRLGAYGKTARGGDDLHSED